MLSFDEAVIALRDQTRLPVERCEAIVRADPAYRDIAPPIVVRDERVLEKAEQVEIRKLALAYGFKVKNLSQYRPAKVSLGFPDLLLIHRRMPLMLWWETKRQVGGALSPAQAEFRDDCTRCSHAHGFGDRYHFVEKLIELDLACRGSGPYGIEPIRFQENRVRHTGTVKWFNDTKGFGFIACDGGTDLADCFVHYSDIVQPEGRKTLKEGARVEFMLEESDRGPRARKVMPIDDAQPPASF